VTVREAASMTGSGAMPATETSVAPLSARSLKECLVPTARTRPPAATARRTSSTVRAVITSRAVNW
jgi:hypothetical protein